MSDGAERLRHVAERVFPAGARLIVVGREGEVVLLASWKLGTDPERPNKRSRTVRVTLSEEAMSDYRRGAEGERDAADARFATLLKSRLERFDPMHDTPLGTEPPIEPWSVGTIELNG